MPTYWRNESDYSFTEGLAPKWWAWEFLRRNADYRRDWHEKLRDYELHGEHRLPPPIKTGGTRGLSPEDPDFLLATGRFYREAWDRWNLWGYVNPSQERPTHLEFLVFVGAATLPEGFPEVPKEPQQKELTVYPHDILLRMDFRWPISRLLQEARFLLEHAQTGFRAAGYKLLRTRRMPENWRLYLRALDARADGASYKQIAEVLFPNEAGDPDRKVGETLRQARRLLKPSGYVKILRP